MSRARWRAANREGDAHVVFVAWRGEGNGPGRGRGADEPVLRDVTSLRRAAGQGGRGPVSQDHGRGRSSAEAGSATDVERGLPARAAPRRPLLAQRPGGGAEVASPGGGLGAPPQSGGGLRQAGGAAEGAGRAPGLAGPTRERSPVAIHG